MKFNFYAKHQKEVDYIEMNFEEDCLPEILEKFEDFLKGCGFEFDGRVSITNDE